MGNMKPSSPLIAVTRFAHSPEAGRSVVDTFSAPIGKTGCTLAGFLELKRGPFLPDSLLELMKTTIKRTIGATPPPEELEERFEDALLAVNDVLKRHFSEDDQSSDQLLAAALVLVSTEHAAFAVTGSSRAFLLKRELPRAGADWTNVIANEPSTKKSSFFGSLFHGNVAPGDALLVCSDRFFDVIAGEKLKTVLKKVIGGDLPDHLEELLVERAMPVAAIIAQGVPQKKEGMARGQRGSRVWGLSLSLGTGQSALKAAARALTQGIRAVIDALLPPAGEQIQQESPAVLKTETAPKIALLPKLLAHKKLAVALLVAVLALTILGNGVSQRRRQQERFRYNELLERIAAEQREAESALLYRDNLRARAALARGRELLLQLPLTTNARVQRAAVIREELERISMKFQYLVPTESKTILTFFGNEESTAFHPSVITLIRQEKKTRLLLVDGQLRRFGTVNPTLDNPKLKRLETQPLPAPITGTLPTDRGALLLHSDNTVSELLLDATVAIEPRPIASTPKTISSAAWYQKKLYITDGENERITKHLPTSGGFAKGTIWTQKRPELREVTAMTIDGAIYLGSANGQILKFFQGKPQDFPLAVDPMPTGALHLLTISDTPYLYVLSPATRRLMVIQKDTDEKRSAGSVVAQYVVSNWKNLKSFAVDEKTRAAYVLNGDALEKIELTHLTKIKPATPTKKTP